MTTLFLESMKHNVFKHSECLGKWLHRFSIVAEYPEGVLENCEICHKSRFFKIIDDQVDNQHYMDWHIRSALPFNHPYYFHEHVYNPYSDLIPSPYA